MTAHAARAPHGRAVVVTTPRGAVVVKTGRRRPRSAEHRAAVALVRAIADAHDLTGGLYR